MKWWQWVAVGVPALLATGCGDDEFALPKEWAKTVRQYNYIAVWPAREDLQVGDIYAVCNDSTTEGVVNALQSDALPRLLGRLNVKEALASNYQKSVYLPTRPIVPASGVQARPPSASDVQATVRGMAVALPDLGSVTVTSSKFGASVPAGSFLGSLGLSSESLKSVSMSVPSAVSYGLPHDELRKVISAKEGNTDAYSQDNKDSLDNLAKFCASHTATLIVVSEVVAAYSIRVSMEFNEGTKAAAKVAMLLPPESQRALVTKALGNLFGVKMPDDSGGGQGGQSGQQSASEVQTPPPAVDADKLVRNTKEVVEALKAAVAINNKDLGPDFPGVSASFASATDSQLSLDTQFDRPVTYAFRYLALCSAGSASAVAALGRRANSMCGDNQADGDAGSGITPAFTKLTK